MTLPAHFRLWTIALLLSAAQPVCAVDYSAPANPLRNADLAQARAALAHEDWPGAIESLEKVIAKEPRNADAYSLLGFASRKSGKLDKAFAHYAKALNLDPKHLGAYEYQGEAFLMAKQPTKAEANLATLGQLCNKQCDEYKTLQKSIAAYQARKK